MAKLDKNRLIFGALLLVLITMAEIVLHALQIPGWPVLFVMLFFFLAHMDKKVAPNIIIGALVGIGCFVIAKPIIRILYPITGLEMGRLLFILAIVAAIILFKEIVPKVFNDYTFAYLLISGLAAKVPSSSPNPYIWMAVTLVGGTFFIFAILGMRQIVTIMAIKRARAAAAKTSAP